MALRKIEHGHYFEDFEVGHIFKHHWGRTINEGDNSLFTSVTMNFNPIYFNREYAKSMGYRDVVVNHMLVINVVFGLSVEDLSERAIAHLGYEKMKFLAHRLSGRHADLAIRGAVKARYLAARSRGREVSHHRLQPGGREGA